MPLGTAVSGPGREGELGTSSEWPRTRVLSPLAHIVLSGPRRGASAAGAGAIPPPPSVPAPGSGRHTGSEEGGLGWSGRSPRCWGSATDLAVGLRLP